MQELDLIKFFVMPLEQAKMNYMISGSVATSLFGEPRYTADIDIALFPLSNQITELTSLFPLSDYYCPPSDVIKIECEREARGHFNIIHHATGLKADVYPSKNHPYLNWALRNKKRISTDLGDINFAPPEYVILQKLAFYQEGNHSKHIRDIFAVVKNNQLDFSLMQEAVTKLHLTDEWHAVIQELN